ncbi:MAG: methyltransferase domain-containing protein [Candidatus Firestonebacteria bacterium]|nr:methyltransferase domain-containing protein [Candidatus Firestonebacteria bacterium]
METTRYSRLAAGCEPLSCCSGLEGNLKPANGDAVLDIGCGRGELLTRLAKRYGSAIRWVGVDAEPAMLDRARELSTGLAVAWVLGDLEFLPFKTGEFSWVIGDCVFNHAVDKSSTAKEIFRVLRPGGRLVLADPASRDPLPAAIRSDPEQRAACFGGCLTSDELKDVFENVGFVGLEITKTREYIKNGYFFYAVQVTANKPEEI